MHKVTSEQFENILKCLVEPKEEQEKVFSSLELNPYEYCENGSELEFNTVIYEQDISERFVEAQSYPEDFSVFSAERAEDILAGAKLTREEMEQLKSAFIEEQRNSPDAEYATVSAISDGAQTVYVLYFESCHGGYGIGINEFFGFFETEEASREKMDNLEGITIV